MASPENPNSAAEHEIIIEATIGGGDITPKEASRLEKILVNAPDDFATRMKLLGYYFRSLRTNKRKGAMKLNHVLWVINNRPDIDQFAMPLCQLDPDLEPDSFAPAKEAWLRKLDQQPDNPKLLVNASSFFEFSDEQFSFSLLERAQSIEPDNLAIESELAHYYLRSADGADSAIKKLLYQKALAGFERLLAADADKQQRFTNLTDVAISAYGAGYMDRADAVSREMLESAAKLEKNWNTGNAIYWANIVLGKIYLAKGDLDQSCTYLIRASETCGSPQLDTFGPEFELCESLANQGRIDASITYLSNCSKFWKSSSGQLRKWQKQLTNGIVPGFEKV